MRQRGSAATSTPSTITPDGHTIQHPPEEKNEFVPPMAPKSTGHQIGPGVVPTEDMGEEIRAVWGEELFTPVQYNSFRVGPFEGTTLVRAGENRNDAKRRLRAQLSVMAQEEFDEKLPVYLKNLATARGMAQKAGLK